MLEVDWSRRENVKTFEARGLSQLAVDIYDLNNVFVRSKFLKKGSQLS